MCGNISLIIALLADIFIAHIALNPISTFLRQFYSGDLVNFVDSTIIFFITILIIWWFDQMVALPWWTWLVLLLKYLFIDSPTQCYALFWKLIWGVSSKYLWNSSGNRYCKKDKSKGEVNVVKISQIRIQKMKNNVAMASFLFCLVKFGKNSILCCYKKGKKYLVWVVL